MASIENETITLTKDEWLKVTGRIAELEVLIKRQSQIAYYLQRSVHDDGFDWWTDEMWDEKEAVDNAVRQALQARAALEDNHNE